MKMKTFALVSSFTLSFVLFSAPVFAVTGNLIVTQSGRSVPDATVKIETAEGESIGETRTDSEGRATLSLPEGFIVRPEVVKVEEAAGNTITYKWPVKLSMTPIKSVPSETGAFQIDSGALSLVSMDLDGGICALDKDVVSVIEKAAQPVSVGKNADVGTGARRKQKVAEQATGMLGGALSGLTKGVFGGRGGDDKAEKAPKLAKDPCSDSMKRTFSDPATGTKIRVGGKMTQKGLHISTTILDSPDKGTFQTVYLMDDNGNKAGPTLYEIYELYREWTLTVSWTYTRWSGGKQIEHKEGGWSEGGRDILGTFAVPKENDGIWKQMGFSNAVAGIKGLGALFPIAPEILQTDRMHLVVHVTRPAQQAVNTTAYVMSMPPLASGGLNLLKSF